MAEDLDDTDDEDEPDDMELSDDDLDDFVDEGDGDEDTEVALDPKERAARALAVRRAIEARQEEKRMDEDLNYLELDFGEDE